VDQDVAECINLIIWREDLTEAKIKAKSSDAGKLLRWIMNMTDFDNFKAPERPVRLEEEVKKALIKRVQSARPPKKA
jgi:hypothetical protein